MRFETVDHRILGAVRFVDAVTLQQVSDALRVASDTASLTPNRSGLFIIRSAAGLETHTVSFPSPPAAPPVASLPVTIAVTDTARRYLNRRATLALPRDPDPANAAQSSSLFQPVEVRLFPSPSAALSTGWAAVRATLKTKNSGTGIAGALVRVTSKASGSLLGSGISDARGEALVAIPGIPITTFEAGSGPVMATEIDVTIQAFFDPQAPAATTADAYETNLNALFAAMGNPVSAVVPVPDPDDLETRHDALKKSDPVDAKLASGRTLPLVIAIDV